MTGLTMITFISLGTLNGQIYLQLEKANTLDVQKYQAGETIKFRLKQFEENWVTAKIVEILPTDDAIVFYDQIVHLDEITHFEYQRPWANASGKILMGFGSSWLIFGGAIEGLASIGAIESNYRFGTDTAIIGGSTLISGFLINKLWSKAVKKMNKNNRLRIIDVTF